MPLLGQSPKVSVTLVYFMQLLYSVAVLINLLGCFWWGPSLLALLVLRRHYRQTCRRSCLLFRSECLYLFMPFVFGWKYPAMQRFHIPG